MVWFTLYDPVAQTDLSEGTPSYAVLIDKHGCSLRSYSQGRAFSSRAGTAALSFHFAAFPRREPDFLLQVVFPDHRLPIKVLQALLFALCQKLGVHPQHVLPF